MIKKLKRPFIVVEGIDGSGKSTLVKQLNDFLVREDKPIYTTYEPTGHDIGQSIRSIIKNNKVGYTPETIATMFMLDRLNHTNIIKKAQYDKISKFVVCDRYSLSTLAYLKASISNDRWNKISPDFFKLTSLINPKPDFLVVILPDVDVCLKRLSENRTEFDMYENKDFLHKVKIAYTKLFSSDGNGLFCSEQGLMTGFFNYNNPSKEEMFDLVKNSFLDYYSKYLLDEFFLICELYELKTDCYNILRYFPFLENTNNEKEFLCGQNFYANVVMDELSWSVKNIGTNVMDYYKDIYKPYSEHRSNFKVQV